MKSYLDRYIETLLAKGRSTFTRDELLQQFDSGAAAIRQCLHRLSRQKAVLPIRGGFYVIIPPEYRAAGRLPPALFMDELMRYLKRPYYVGLLSAAALHGAGHQQPQSFWVITGKPPVRPIQRAGLNIRFAVKSEMPQQGLEQKKTPSGYLTVSSPERTALDLMIYLKQSGGLPAVTAVLEELAELMTPEKVKQAAERSVPSAALQRLGFVLDEVLARSELTGPLYEELQTRRFFHIPLDPAETKDRGPINKKWKISLNAGLETDR